MTKPNDPPDRDFRATLPADLQALDRELSGIRIEERPSFGPELEGELAEAWKVHQASRTKARPAWRRTLLAAAIAGLMIAGVSVPGARAAVLELVRTVAEEAFPGFFAAEEQAEIQLPEIRVQEEPVTAPTSEVVLSTADVSDEPAPAPVEFPTLPEVEVTLPELISRQEAEEIVASEYPEELKRAGVEGSVELQFWVDELGRPDNIGFKNGSTNNQLNFAAMRAARGFRFRPATRNGVAVGTWVRVTVHFYAMTGTGFIGSDTTSPGG
ncbi:MAG: energy transducer TonB [Gemmatimonadetes bacterium]|nr:energy transducer TonB [Gemmatimonadota bacterium]NNM06751.1 energy transducer TonB [Gemmatimonadota bacterium]